MFRKEKKELMERICMGTDGMVECSQFLNKKEQALCLILKDSELYVQRKVPSNILNRQAYVC